MLLYRELRLLFAFTLSFPLIYGSNTDKQVAQELILCMDTLKIHNPIHMLSLNLNLYVKIDCCFPKLLIY